MAITRTAWTDDDGSGTTGTIINNAEKTTLYNQIDAAIDGADATTRSVAKGGTGAATLAAHGVVIGEGTSAVAVSGAGTVGQVFASNGASADPTFQTPSGMTAPTTTGNITAEPIPAGIGPLATYHNNATLKTIQGMVAGLDGQLWFHYSKGAGQVDLAHLHASGTALGKLKLIATTAGATSLAAGSGVAVFQYDATVTQWRLVAHEQGAWIAYTPTWGNVGTANTLGNGTIAGAYRLTGTTLEFRVSLVWGTTTTGGSSVYTFTFPFSVAAASDRMPFPAYILDASAGAYAAVGKYFTATTFVVYESNAGFSGGINNATPVTFTTSDQIYANGQVELT